MAAIEVLGLYPDDPTSGKARAKAAQTGDTFVIGDFKVDNTGKIITPLLTPFITNASSATSGLGWVNSTNLGWYVTGVERIRFGSGGRIGVSDGISLGPSPGTTDTFLLRDAANAVAQRNATTAQTFRIYNTFTDASNYERLSIGWSGNVMTIAAEAAGTGTKRNLALDGANRASKISDVSSGTDAAYETAINAIIDALESHGLSATS